MPTDPHRAPRKQSLRGWNLGGVSYPLRWMVVLTLVPSRNKVLHLAAEYGCYLSSCCGLSSSSSGGVPRYRAPRKCNFRGWLGRGGLSPEALAKGGLSRVTSNKYPHRCHCEGVRSTLKTLSYDCGNPVQYVCGRMPAVLFYSLDRHDRFTPSR